MLDIFLLKKKKHVNIIRKIHMSKKKIKLNKNATKIEKSLASCNRESLHFHMKS